VNELHMTFANISSQGRSSVKSYSTLCSEKNIDFCFLAYLLEQELCYRKQIVHQLHTQYVEGTIGLNITL